MTRTTILAGALLAASATTVFADDADDAYQRGRSAFKAGRVHEACQAFEASERLAPKNQTEKSLAACYEQDGKPVAAARAYRMIGDIASATRLEARAPKLRFTLSQRPDGLVIRVDGAVVASTGDVMVDAGPHDVVATAPGFEGHAHAAVDRDRAIVDVILRMEEKAAPPTPEPEPPTAPAAPATVVHELELIQPSPPPIEHAPRDHRVRNAAILGAAGLAVLAGGIVMFAASSSKFDDEHALCPRSQCATPDDLAKAKSLLDDGHTYRGISYAAGIGGIALIGVGAYLFLRPHEEAPRVSLQVAPGTAGIAYTARF